MYAKCQFRVGRSVGRQNKKNITMKPLNSGHLQVLKNMTVIKRCLLLGGSLTKIVTFETKSFVHYSRHVRYLRCPLLEGFTVFDS